MFTDEQEIDTSWTETTRRNPDRHWLRYASDVTHEEWAVIEPFMPPTSKVGRPRKVRLRDIWNAIQYIGHTGCQWLAMPKEIPPYSTVQCYFYKFRDEGLLELINDVLVMAARRQEGREAMMLAKRSRAEIVIL